MRIVLVSCGCVGSTAGAAQVEMAVESLRAIAANVLCAAPSCSVASMRVGLDCYTCTHW